jgi:hypothetical protein
VHLLLSGSMVTPVRAIEFHLKYTKADMQRDTGKPSVVTANPL